jgi:hypothetical protein
VPHHPIRHSPAHAQVWMSAAAPIDDPSMFLQQTEPLLVQSVHGRLIAGQDHEQRIGLW